ncbi:MAG: DUF4238 domain-containing protein [Phenylobacterium sp.]
MSSRIGRSRMSVPQPPHRHHFVPRMLQKHFVDREGWLYAARRCNPTPEIFRGRPDTLFFERHLYSEIEEDGRRVPRTEGRLAGLEDLAAGLFERILTAARAGRPPDLTSDDLDLWYLFLTIQWKRAPDMRNSQEGQAMADDVFRSTIDRARAHFPHQSDEIDRLSTPGQRARLIHNARLSALGVTEGVLDALRSRGMAVLRVAQPNKQFVLASRPVVKLTSPGKTHLRHPECETWLAIAPDVAVGLGLGAGRVSLHPVSAENVRHINLAVASQSSMIASASPPLIRSLLRPR